MERSVRQQYFEARKNGRPIAIQIYEEIKEEGIDKKEERERDREYRRIKREFGVNALYIEINDLKLERDRYKNMVMANKESWIYKLHQEEIRLDSREDKLKEKEKQLKEELEELNLEKNQRKENDRNFRINANTKSLQEKCIYLQSQIDVIYQNNASPEFVQNLIRENEYKIILNRNRQLMEEIHLIQRQRDEALKCLNEMRIRDIIPTDAFKTH